MRTARILDLRRKRRTTDGVPSPPVVSCLTSDSVGCIIVTIGLPDPDDLSPILISMSPVHAHVSARKNLRGHQSILDRMRPLFMLWRKESRHFLRGQHFGEGQVCEVCRQPISQVRLEAVPWTHL